MSKGNYFYVPDTARVAIADNEVSLEELANLIASISFDNPTAKVNYSIEVVQTKLQ